MKNVTYFQTASLHPLGLICRHGGKILVKNGPLKDLAKLGSTLAFTKLEIKYWKIKLCAEYATKSVSTPGGTTNLNQHLQNHHSDVWSSASTSTGGGKKIYSISDNITDEAASCKDATKFCKLQSGYWEYWRINFVEIYYQYLLWIASISEA